MDALEFGRAILKQQSFSTLLGTELTRFEDGEVEMRLALRPEHMQQHGFAHGGVISYLADNALTYAGGAALGDVLTAEMKINYTRPGKGEALIVRARAVTVGKRQAVCRAEVFAVAQGEEKICAVAQGTIMARGA